MYANVRRLLLLTALSAPQLSHLNGGADENLRAPDVSLNGEQSDPDLLQELRGELPKEIILLAATGVISLGAGVLLSQASQAFRQRRERQELSTGSMIDHDHARVQIHVLTTHQDSPLLLIRTISPDDTWAEVLKASALASSLRSAAGGHNELNPSVTIPSDLRRALFVALRNSISASNQPVPGSQKNYMLFITCEDPQNANTAYQTAIRVFLITRQDLDKFKDSNWINGLKIERQEYRFRLLALQKLAQMVANNQLVENVHWTNIAIPSRDDHVPTGTPELPKWSSN